MEKVKEIKKDKKNEDIIVLDGGINRKDLEPQFACCYGAFFATRW